MSALPASGSKTAPVDLSAAPAVANEANVAPAVQSVSQPLKLNVQFVAPAHAGHRKLLTRAVLTRWVGAALFAPAELTLRFVDSDEGRVLNRGYRGKDYATNVLTFAYAESEEDPVTGDIILCCPVVEREAQEQGKPLVAHYAHLIVHGVLHAQGYDHEDDEEAAEMEAIETELMAALGYPDPYAEQNVADEVAPQVAPDVTRDVTPAATPKANPTAQS